MDDNQDTTYKHAIVTGAARGIGKTIALKLATSGLDVVVSDVLLDEAREVAEELNSLGVQAMAIKADVSRVEDVETLIKTTVDQWGSVDFLVNNAGVTRDNLAVRMSEQEWDMVLDINLKGTFLCSQAAAKVMMKQRFGRIVNIASVSGILGTPGQANYASSKAGIIALTKTFARELGKRNITVNAVAPGFVLTEMTEKLPDKVKEEYIANIPLKRAGTPEDIAEVVWFLISPSASYITGTVINVSGGLLI
ncbi:MAG: 3-oxoacyl-[acyl-carrier-protein] reductase [Candidatus Aminicenantes bacterium]|nr:3-oxoacyl-[acyl-carrier-protein] reductase [Candidatus Aminicenantes bacterium]NIM83384.1 3-oxoacyl-[acyl-carrier-protein] reductase [Candidatus Aminicenantes bacterium]NIN22776.1 3-oxoacyl-[acyl-carrier-protein] reductase [Candidatus Aminicenantes bacterium]NIN46510.1 3-oxoacyl-[acyl-carrier-protein] reductase [Candidatus Aminicenantes bacterium]NIN89415.1 3-oxoacyl-[acyl-carrier-protein] reductase [Candidatus Aminicenantes bacterium]